MEGYDFASGLINRDEQKMSSCLSFHETPVILSKSNGLREAFQ